MRYEIMSLSAEAVICNSTVDKTRNVFLVNLNDPQTYDAVVLSIGLHQDNAFYYQLRKVLQCAEKPDALEQYLVYIDFSGKLFGAKADENDRKNAKSILKNGIDIILPEESDPIHFTAFDKSNSMARASQITYISNEMVIREDCHNICIRDELNLRLMLGMDFRDEDSKVAVILSKFYAYRGLYLSDSRRINLSDRFPLNEETVIVLKDKVTSHHRSVSLVCARERENNSNQWHAFRSDVPADDDQTRTAKKDLAPKIDRYDGEGLICPEYAQELDRQLRSEAQRKDNFRPILHLLEGAGFDFPRKETEQFIDQLIRSRSLQIGQAILQYCSSRWNCSPEEAKDRISKMEQSETLRTLVTQAAANITTSFQVRLPFGKGMLHEADWNGFLDEFMQEYQKNHPGFSIGSEPLIIEDAFGCLRDLSKARILLTKSMFKCAGWLKDYCCKKRKQNPELYADPMKYYFAQFKKYEHALYIANVNTGLHNSGTTRLDYQFLHTLSLDEAAMSTLVRQHFERCDDEAFRNVTGKYPDEISMSGEEWFEEDNALPAWQQILLKAPSFSVNKRIEGMMFSTKETLRRATIRGRLLVSGECRFLSRDLLSLMADLAFGLKQNKDEGLQNVFDGAWRKTFTKSHCLGYNSFYMAQSVQKLRPNQLCAVLRSPHLSRNEECLMSAAAFTPGSGQEKFRYYKQFLSHLTGVFMVGYDSLVPNALAGADFDGDLVKIITEKTIVNAIRSTGYQGSNNSRTMPIIMIPSKGAKPQEIPKELIDYFTISNTFSGRVGMISNMAIAAGRTQYTDRSPDVEQDGQIGQSNISAYDIGKGKLLAAVVGYDSASPDEKERLQSALSGKNKSNGLKVAFGEEKSKGFRYFTSYEEIFLASFSLLTENDTLLVNENTVSLLFSQIRNIRMLPDARKELLRQTLAVKNNGLGLRVEIVGTDNTLYVKSCGDLLKDDFLQLLESVGYPDQCAVLTILTGLEIDACKNGNHPDLDLDDLAALQQRANNEYFLKVHQEFKKLHKFKGWSIQKSGEDYSVLEKNRVQVRFFVRKPLDGRTIDYLPWLYCSNWLSETEIKRKRIPIRKMLDFEPLEKQGDAAAYKRERKLLSEARKILDAYNHVIQVSSQDTAARNAYEQARFQSRVKTVLSLQYDKDCRSLSPEGKSIQELVEAAYYSVRNAILRFAIKNQTNDETQAAQDYLEYFVNSRWHFTSPKYRTSRLYELLQLDPNESGDVLDDDLVKLLTNFRVSGYRVLYYIVKDVALSGTFTMDVEEDVQSDEAETQDSLSEYHRRYLKLYHAAKQKKMSAEIWKRVLADTCRSDLLELYSGNAGSALEAVLRLPESADASERFFWEVFKASEIYAKRKRPPSGDSISDNNGVNA